MSEKKDETFKNDNIRLGFFFDLRQNQRSKMRKSVINALALIAVTQ